MARVFTDDLNVTIGIFGVRQKEGGINARNSILVCCGQKCLRLICHAVFFQYRFAAQMGILDYLPVCLDPPVEARGCFRSAALKFDPVSREWVYAMQAE